MTSLTTFTHFSSLPTELRHEIWSLNLPGPRLVSLQYNYSPHPNTRTTNTDIIRGCTSTTLIPINLHTTRESRHHALKYYKLSFNLPHGEPKVFFCPTLDVLFFGPRSEFIEAFKQFSVAAAMMEESEKSKVKRLAVHEDLFKFREGDLSWDRMRIFQDSLPRKFDQVEEVAILSDSMGSTSTFTYRWMTREWLDHGLEKWFDESVMESVREEAQCEGFRHERWPVLPSGRPHKAIPSEADTQETPRICRACRESTGYWNQFESIEGPKLGLEKRRTSPPW